MIKKILKFLLIVQTVSNKGKNPKLGRGFSQAHRLNPFNPLSYITVFIAIITGILMFGFVGVWKEFDMDNPFKWN
jgi:predicted PurR-regulated permease PerM